MTAAGVIPHDEFTAPQRVSKERLEELKAMDDDPEAIMQALREQVKDHGKDT